VPCLGFSCTPHTGGGGGESLAWRPPAVADFRACLPVAFPPSIASPIAPSQVSSSPLGHQRSKGKGKVKEERIVTMPCYVQHSKRHAGHNTTHFLFFFPFVDLLTLSLPITIIIPYIHRTATTTTTRTPTEPLRQSEGTRAVRRYQRRRKQGREQARWQSLQRQHRVSTPSASSSQG